MPTKIIKKKIYYHHPIRWTYSRYRATLKLDNKRFAIVTPDSINALSKTDEKILMDALNGTCSSMIQISWVGKASKRKKKGK